MHTVTQHIRRHIFEQLGMIKKESDQMPDIEVLKKSEWCDEFEQLMRNRLIMGAFRYGQLAVEDGKEYDRMGSILKRISAYQDTGNLEYLVDIANLCLVEFIKKPHPSSHWAAQDDAEHAQEIAKKRQGGD